MSQSKDETATRDRRPAVRIPDLIWAPLAVGSLLLAVGLAGLASGQPWPPGGRVLTLDFIPEPDRVTPPATAGFALVMLATTARGDAYTFAEREAVFARSGFARSEFHALPPTTQQAVVSYER